MARMEYPPLAELAQELIKRHPEAFRQVPLVNDILFVLDDEAEPKSKGNLVMARVSKIPTKFEDFVYSGLKLWILEWFSANNGNLTINQKHLLMAHELMHFEYDEEEGLHRLRGHDVEEFHLISDRFGTSWTSTTRGDVDDIMAADFRWGAVGQKRLDLAGTAAELVGAFGLEGARAVVGAVKDMRERSSDVGAIMQEAAAEINSGALDTDGTKVTATVHPSNVRQLRQAATSGESAG